MCNRKVIVNKIRINTAFDNMQNRKKEVKTYYYVDVSTEGSMRGVPEVGAFETPTERDEYVHSMNKYFGKVKYMKVTYRELVNQKIRRINHAFEGELTPSIETNVVNQGV